MVLHITEGEGKALTEKGRKVLQIVSSVGPVAVGVASIGTLGDGFWSPGLRG